MEDEMDDSERMWGSFELAMVGEGVGDGENGGGGGWTEGDGEGTRVGMALTEIGGGCGGWRKTAGV